jgi:hypothetical protein
MLRKLYAALFPKSDDKESGNVIVGLAVWLVLISGTTFVSLIDAFH